MGAFCVRAERNITVKKTKILLSILTITVCILFGCEKKNTVYLTQYETEETAEQEESSGTDQEPEQEIPQEEREPALIIHICGAVERPGVYELPGGSRIYQAIEEAGGFTDEADRDYLNQAKGLEDGIRLYVPTREETSQDGWTGEEAAVGTGQENRPGLVNINTADEKELCTLAGIGSSKAKSIIAYREANGRYEKIEDVMKVEGIKQGLFAKIRDSITV
ncbi:MAG: helix-hairpin-helix domain-containing protein [Lachnospiraceae bacterium]|nr:hypothetical protein [Lachnospiraceae bacterium]MDE6976246.1 helix-hairpin-helix domain-containing protein [Lachnospiraceae bacterium]